MGRLGGLALLWAAAFGLRLLYIHQSQSSPFFDFPLVDAKTYTEAARLLAQTGQWSGAAGPYWQPPLYVYFLGILYALFDPSYYLPRLVQAALGASACVLVYLLGRRVFTASIPWVGAGLAVLYSPFIFFEAEFLPSILAIVLNLLGLLALLWSSQGNLWRSLLPGCLFGLSALCVANVLLFVPVAALWLVWAHRHRPNPERFLRPMPLLLGALMAIAPITARNYLVGDDLVLISTNAGLNFYIGNNAEYDRTIQIQPGPAWNALVKRPRLEAGATKASEQSRFFFAQAGDFIRTQPLAYLKLQLFKLYQFFNGNEIGRNQDLYFARQYSSLLQILLWKYGLAFPFGLLAPLALTGLGLGWHRGLHRRPEPLLLLLFAGVYTLSVVLFFVSARYRLPVVPILLLWAAYGGREIFLCWRQRHYRPLGAALGALLALVFLCNIGTGEMNMAGDAHTQHRLAYVYEKKGLNTNAIAIYKQVLELAPDNQEARFNLASLYARNGQYNRAIDTYRRFIRDSPDATDAYLALGNVYLQTRRFSQAISIYRQLLDKPGADIADTKGRIAYAHTQVGDLEKAAASYRQLIALRPDSLLARYQLGQLYEQLTHRDSAQAQYRQILSLDSTYTDASYRLARLLFAAEQPETAKAHLKRIIAQSPDAVQARWLLASQYVVEHRGDDAMAQAKAILALNPEHQQANRLAGHLYIIQGDTLKGTQHLDRFTQNYREDRQAEIFEELKKKWSKQLKNVKGR